MKRILGYFFQGLLFIAPAAIVLWIVFKLFMLIDGIIVNNFEWAFPGMGIVILFVTITLIGYLGSTIIAKPIEFYWNQLLNKAPILKSLYDAVSDLVQALLGKKKAFKNPVLVRLSKDVELEKPGFVTNETLEHLGIEGKKVAVYFPHSYAFSGNVFIVNADMVKTINVNSTDLMKFIISGGVAE